ncbi:S26 family signal peptidase [Phytomonospora sp. NPDC050363]|uniref:S26 family signal peptidase n=1 Tax=Phytomonospora sp. NPDC050363 TaxID=3155642 RepID=UPI0034076369
MGALVLAGLVAAWWVHRAYVAITVEGSSMTPTLAPGDRVLIRRGRRGLKRDRIVVIREPTGLGGWSQSPPAGRDLRASGWYIKRAVAMPGDPMDARVVGHGDVVPDGHILVIGDHPHSGDSKQHGPCPVDQILGVVVRRMERAPSYSREGDREPGYGQ